MIIGIGTDLANIGRIEKTLDRFGERFKKRCFTPIEQARADRTFYPPAVYARRWAAKEACVKALGTGLSMGISWVDMEVRNLRTGQPTMRLTGWALKRLEDLTPEGYIPNINVSLTDDHPWAQAFVVIDVQKEEAQDGEG